MFTNKRVERELSDLKQEIVELRREIIKIGSDDWIIVNNYGTWIKVKDVTVAILNYLGLEITQIPTEIIAIKKDD